MFKFIPNEKYPTKSMQTLKKLKWMCSFVRLDSENETQIQRE